MRTSLTRPALALIGIYIMLILLSSCPIDPAFSSTGHHHHNTTHHDKAAHSLLCVWACQISSASAFTTLQQLLQPSLTLIGLILASSVVFSSPGSDSLHARGPPVALL